MELFTLTAHTGVTDITPAKTFAQHAAFAPAKKLPHFYINNFMKKICLFVFVVLSIAGTKSFAQATNGIYESYAIMSIKGGANAFYDMNAATANPDFQGSNLGIFNSTQSLVVKGGQNKTFKCGGGNITGSNFNYRVWLTSAGASGTFTVLPMSFISNDAGGCGGNQTWQGTAGVANIISGLTTQGNYTLEVYSDAPGSPGTAFSSNGGANYKATFTFTGPNSTWTGATSSWTATSNWNTGVVPDATTDVIIPTGLTNYPAISSGTVTAHNISIASGASVTVSGTGIFSLYGTATTTAGGVFNLQNATLDLAGVGSSIGGSNIVNGTVKMLTLSSGGVSSIVTGSTNMLKVTDSVKFLNSNNTFTTNGNLTLVSGATATASIGDITNRGAISGNSIVGNASVERYIAAGRKFRFIAINTVAGTGSTNTVKANWMEGQALGANAGAANRGMWISGFPATDFDELSNAPTMKWWNGTAYVPITAPTTYDIRSHSAYMTYIRGDRSCTNLTGGSATPTVLRTFGGLAQGSSALNNVPSGSGYTAIGNPYASAIDLTRLTYTGAGASNPINIYVWDPNLAGGSGLGAYQTLSSTGPGANFTITPGGGSYGAATTMNIIESGQAFFIQGSAASRDIQFVEAAKNPRANAAFFTAGNEQTLRGKLYMKEGGIPTLMDGFMSIFNPNYNTAADPNDARKPVNLNENVSIKRDGEKLSVEYRNIPDENDTIKIAINGMRVRDYQWTFDLNNMDAPGRAGFLADQYLGTSTRLNLNGTNTVDFSVNSNAGSWAADRFYITFMQAPVPAAAISGIAAARNADGTVAVKWTAVNEVNTDMYELERSNDGRTFSTIHTENVSRNTTGSSVYLYNDLQAGRQENYYRIKIISQDAAPRYSATAKVIATEDAATVSVKPNPVAGKIINLQINNGLPGNYAVQVVNTAGQVIYSGNIKVTGGMVMQRIELNKNTVAGKYNLVLLNNSDRHQNIIPVFIMP